MPPRRSIPAILREALTAEEVTLPVAPGRPPLAMRLVARQHTEYTRVDVGTLELSPDPTVHTFWLAIDLEAFEYVTRAPTGWEDVIGADIEDGDTEDGAGPTLSILLRTAFAPAQPLVNATHRDDRSSTSSGLLADTVPIARLVVLEWPAWMAGRQDWVAHLDEDSDETASLIPLIEAVRRESWRERLMEDFILDSPLISGSLFYARSLEVHPAARGAYLGLRLLRHALRCLTRAPGDLAALSPAPLRHRQFEADIPRETLWTHVVSPGQGRTVELPAWPEIERLVRYYGMLGFRGLGTRAEAVRQHAELGELPLMYHWIGGAALGPGDPYRSDLAWEAVR